MIRHRNGYRSSFSIIRFYTEDGNEFTFSAERNYELPIGEKVKVIYKEDGTDAEVFSFIGFFLSPMIYGLTPLILWAAASLSFIAKGESVTFSFKGVRKNKNENADVLKMKDDLLMTSFKKLNSKYNKKP